MPNKWRYFKSPISDEAEVVLGEVQSGATHFTTSIKEARLICAAPEMLELLKRSAKYILNECRGDYLKSPWADIAKLIEKIEP